MKESEFYTNPHEEKVERLRNRRLVYLLLAIVCNIMPLISPIYRFNADQGIIYERSYRMNLVEITTLLTENTTGIVSKGACQNILPMTIMLALFILSCAVIFIMNFTYRRYTMWGCYVAVVFGVIYYALVIDCGVRATDDLCATLVPNWTLFFPALSIEMMLMTKLNIEKDIKGDF